MSPQLAGNPTEGTIPVSDSVSSTELIKVMNKCWMRRDWTRRKERRVEATELSILKRETWRELSGDAWLQAHDSQIHQCRASPVRALCKCTGWGWALRGPGSLHKVDQSRLLPFPVGCSSRPPRVSCPNHGDPSVLAFWVEGGGEEEVMWCGWDRGF